MSPAPKTVYSKDYKKPDYQISHVDMTFDLDSEKTKATAEMKIQRAPDTPENAPMWLDGEELTLTGIAVNGKPLSEKEYILTEEGLELLNPRIMTEMVMEMETSRTRTGRVGKIIRSIKTEGAFGPFCKNGPVKPLFMRVPRGKSRNEGRPI